MDHHQQVDLVLLDFRKTFDTVPHCRLLSKLSSYGIHNLTHLWIASWLNEKTAGIAMDGITAGWVWCTTGDGAGSANVFNLYFMILVRMCFLL